MATNDEAVSLRDEFEDWQKDYKIGEYLENTEENRAKLEAMDPRYVWTDHGTCEDPQVTSGYRLYSPTSCCWDNYGWYLAEVPWEPHNGNIDDTFIVYKTATYSSCPSCNPDGEADEGAENCPGDENFPDYECEDGYIHYYFD